jgi:hypothetical protein
MELAPALIAATLFLVASSEGSRAQTGTDASTTDVPVAAQPLGPLFVLADGVGGAEVPNARVGRLVLSDEQRDTLRLLTDTTVIFDVQAGTWIAERPRDAALAAVEDPDARAAD